MPEASPRGRLAMVLHGPYPIGEPRVVQQARAAREAGFEVTVVGTRRDGEPARELVDGVDVIRLAVSHRRGRPLLAMLAEYGAFVAGATYRLARLPRFDVVHVHNPPDALVVAGLAQRLRGARTILDIHDFSADMFEMRFGQHPLIRRALLAIEAAAARSAGAVVTVHEPYRAALMRRGLASSKVIVVSNVPDPELMPERVPSAPDAFRVVYHGTVTHHYGVVRLVAAAAEARRQVPHLSLEIIGEGDLLDQVRESRGARALGSALQLSERYVPRSEALGRVASANVGVIPNLPINLNRYALPWKLLEYATIGVPVVCSDLPTIREHFDESELLFFPAGDTEALALALVQTALDPDAANERAERAKLRAASYEWRRSAERYVELLLRLSARNR